MQTQTGCRCSGCSCGRSGRGNRGGHVLHRGTGDGMRSAALQHLQSSSEEDYLTYLTLMCQVGVPYLLVPKVR